MLFSSCLCTQFDLCHQAIIYVGLILRALRSSNESGCCNECPQCRDLFTSSHVKIAQLNVVVKLEIQIPHSDPQNGQWMLSVFCHWVWRLLVLQWGTRIQSSESRERQFKWKEKEALSLASIWGVPPGEHWAVQSDKVAWDTEWERQREKESGGGKIAWARDWWMKWWMTGGRESISSTVIQQPRCCHILLACATGDNRTPLPDTIHWLIHTCAPMFIQTHLHTHILLISLLPYTLAKTPTWEWLGWCVHAHIYVGMCLYFFLSSGLLFLPFVSPLLVADSCCNKANEFGKWQDSRWYFSEQLPSPSAVGEAASWVSELRVYLCLEVLV